VFGPIVDFPIAIFTLLPMNTNTVLGMIYCSTGGSEEGNTDSGTSRPLAVIASRIRRHNLEVVPMGTEPPRLPAERVSLARDHIFIEVTELEPDVSMFPEPGFYWVSKLPLRDAGFLFAP